MNRIGFLPGLLALAALVSGLLRLNGNGVPGDFAPRHYIDITPPIIEPDTGKGAKKDSLPYPIKDKRHFEEPQKHGLDLETPDVIKKSVKFDSASGTYEERTTVGDNDIEPMRSKTLDEYFREKAEREERDYFRQRAKAANLAQGGGVIPKLYVGPKVFDRIFGGGAVDIRPQGSAELILGWNYNVVRNPALTTRQQKNGQLDFRQKIQLNVVGKIGDRVNLNMNYDTEATFDFENQIKLAWDGKEDDILKKVEVGNVNLPLNSSLIQGGQSLFGVKVQMQFSKLMVTSIISQQRGQTTETTVQGGAQVTQFDIQGHNYDQNRHFFLSHYFADNYDNWLATSPLISSPIIINRVEVWITNRTADFNNARDIVAFMDLGETNPHNPRWVIPGRPPFPDNNANGIYSAYANSEQARQSSSTVNYLRGPGQNLDPIVDFQFQSYARQLGPNEFTYNPRLGYISLNTSLNNDEVIAVAYEYTLNGQVYRVGEFSREIPTDPTNPRALYLKMLKGATVTVNLPIWDLMMKNIYSLGSFNIKAERFRLNVIYADDPSGADLNYLPAQQDPRVNGIPLITLLNSDKVNVQGEPTPDGVYDFLEGLTVNAATGRIIFPVREPFGSHLYKQFSDTIVARNYVFTSLYDSTKWLAQQDVRKNKFFLRGSYQGQSANEISLNAINVPRGSVRVTANGTLLTENVDYVVDYTLGRVKILNTGLLNSGAVIKVSSENNTLFNIQQKTLLGTRLDYKLNDDIVLGGTIMHMFERPITPKVNIGEEPLLNTIYGLDGGLKKDSRWLTRKLDRLPFFSTKEMSSFQLNGEFAQLIPHNPKTMGARGTSFIDDFEAAEVPYDLRLGGNNWFIAATPENQPDLFPETINPQSADVYGHRRARLAWYTLDPIWFRDQRSTSPATPPYMRNNADIRSNHYTREVLQTEVFREKQIPQGSPTNLPTLDLAYYPYLKGQYNYSTDNYDPATGFLRNPKDNWAGITRRIETNDFEAANIAYLEMWLMDPFDTDPQFGAVIDGVNDQNNTTGGNLYFNLGSISEDVIRDSRKSFENGLPASPDVPNLTDITPDWKARVPNIPTINNAFGADDAARERQDVGLDGWNNDDERVQHEAYLQTLEQLYGANSPVYQQALDDPSSDDYKFHSSSEFDNQQLGILQRHQKINGQEGNSKPASFTPDGFPIGRTILPDDEDINRDFTLNIQEEYYQYQIPLFPGQIRVGQNYVTDSAVTSVRLDNGENRRITWYQIRIPVTNFTKKIGNISDFKSIRFLRVFVKGWEQPVVLRFASMQLVRADWRVHLQSLNEPTLSPPVDPASTTKFAQATVNIEANSSKQPVPYRTPPGFFRELDVTQPNMIQQNEQALSLRVCDLQDGDARGVFKATFFDIRNYRNFKMFVHADGANSNLQDGDLTAFIRLGTDLDANYYEFEIPLKVTPNGTTDPRIIWPEANEMNIELEEFYLTKQFRDNAGFPLTQMFKRALADGKNIYIIGLPDMGNIRSIMLGVRNPKAADRPGDDGLPKCGEVWFNEMRVQDFVLDGGWAANLRFVTKLADLGTVSITGARSTIGFGGVDKKLADRNITDNYQWGIQANLELGKFFSKKSGLTIPFFITHSETRINPKFNPLNPDILLTTSIKAAPEEQRNEIRSNATDLTVRRGFNFTNVRKLRINTTKKPKFYDISNFNGTFSFQEYFQRNQILQENLQKTWRGSLGYNFTVQAKYIEPFRKMIKSNSLALIRDFNFTLLPQNYNIRFDIDRYYARMISRNNDNPQTIVPVLYDKNFVLNRVFDIRWDLTRSLKIDYQSTSAARVDEPAGTISREYPERIDSIWQNFLRGGRTTGFNQVINANYNLPFSKIPILNFINSSIRYTANYQWTTAPPAIANIGNTIQNARTIGFTGQMNMINFYNKFPALRKVNSQQSGGRGTQPQQRNRPKPEEEEKDEKEKKKKDEGNKVTDGLLRFLMMVKNVNFTYNRTDGTALPGFQPLPGFLGNDVGMNAPGMPFILGSQNADVRFDMARKGALTVDTSMFNFFMQSVQHQFNARATLQPIKDLQVDLEANNARRDNLQTNFRFDPLINDFTDFGLQNSGNYSTSFNTFRTAFVKDGPLFQSATFDQFSNNRFVIAQRLVAENPDKNLGTSTSQDSARRGFPIGYSRVSQDVLIPAFLAAYSGKNAADISLSPFRNLPSINWRLTYNGLSKMKWAQNFATNISISHGYKSLYTINQFTSPLQLGTEGINPIDSNFYPELEIRDLSIAEQFMPLISADITFKNNITTRVEMRKSRIMNLIIINAQVTEIRTSEFIIGAGYRTNKLNLPWKVRGRKAFLENDLSIRLDFSIREALTIVRKLDAPINEPTQGAELISIKPQIDYALNSKLNMRIFYDRRITNPFVSNQFPTRITQGGVSIRYTLQ